MFANEEDIRSLWKLAKKIRRNFPKMWQFRGDFSTCDIPTLLNTSLHEMGEMDEIVRMCCFLMVISILNHE